MAEQITVRYARRSRTYTVRRAASPQDTPNGHLVAECAQMDMGKLSFAAVLHAIHGSAPPAHAIRVEGDRLVAEFVPVDPQPNGTYLVALLARQAMPGETNDGR
jgi:hypothetical protein